MTAEERHLWYDFLKSYPVRFLRQKVIDNYIVDFYCHSARLIIELDGSQHYEEKGMVNGLHSLEFDFNEDILLEGVKIYESLLKYKNSLR